MIEVGESRDGFICTLKFYSLKFAQVWFGLLQSRAASFSKYSTVAFIGLSFTPTTTTEFDIVEKFLCTYYLVFQVNIGIYSCYYHGEPLL